MNKCKVLTGYTEESDAGIIPIADAIIAGCTNNTNFDFTNGELTDLVLMRADYVQRLSKVPTGTHADVVLKDQSKAKLVNALRVICTEINRQHSGEEAILSTSGAPLCADCMAHKEGSVVYPPPEGLNGNPGGLASELDVRMNKTKGLNDHGAVFAITEVLNAPDDANLWRKEVSTGHSMTIGNLKPATKYLLAGAYRSPTGTALVFCKPILMATKVV